MSSIETDVKSILKGVDYKLDELSTSQNDKSRVEALELAQKLSRVLEKPKDAVLKMSLSCMTVKIGHDLDVYNSLVTGGPATAKQLAVPKKADPVFVENPEDLGRFNTYMEGIRGDRAHWADWSAVQKQILDGAANDPTRPLLVDIAGGRGHDIAHFASQFPEAPGRLILEDPPPVIEDIAKLDPKIERVKHDFFTSQPVKGSCVYYMKSILHDWSDDKCKVILDHVVAAMEKGYSKVVIEDFILPDSGWVCFPS
ncbi:S-adenosyl-L-methionine-dependent methyltransferase [Aspergillus affinis]|uniref:S-adenosyl-L-methionine-dependent methyltransferase n=1 Tax=Aspergillus affinis TaxID=1070780 RepID=UPI0022FE5722|nr:S-adenosyl-L-methionine-dependent methyltransferase [Aspergillus affinis]KAI9043244.1 S-adenosyl-L-methionine-dependent methyltransferase [Aspergillus affinis]